MIISLIAAQAAVAIKEECFRGWASTKSKHLHRDFKDSQPPANICHNCIAKMQRSSLFLFSLVLALALRSRATLQTHFSEELGRTLGLPVDIEAVDSEKAPPPPAFMTKLFECWSGDGKSVAGDCPSKKDFAGDQETEVDLIRSFMGKREYNALITCALAIQC